MLVRSKANVVIATAWPVTDHGATLVWAELAPRLARGEDVEVALCESLETLQSAAADGRTVAGYLASLVDRFPQLEALCEGWLSPRAHHSAAAAGGAVISPGDLACWTVLGV